MAKSFDQLMRQKAMLDKQIAQHERKKQTIAAQIKKQIRLHGLTQEDLFGSGAASPIAKSSSSDEPKFRNESGQSWSGRGPRPLWLRKALEAGATLDQFAADGAAVASAEPAGRSKAVRKNAAKKNSSKAGAKAVKGTPRPVAKRASKQTAATSDSTAEKLKPTQRAAGKKKAAKAPVKRAAAKPVPKKAAAKPASKRGASKPAQKSQAVASVPTASVDAGLTS